MSNLVKYDEYRGAYIPLKYDSVHLDLGPVFTGPAVDRLYEFEKIGLEPDIIIGRLTMLNGLLEGQKILNKVVLNSFYGAEGQYGSYDVRQGIIDNLTAENKKLKNEVQDLERIKKALAEQNNTYFKNIEMLEKSEEKLLGQIDKLEDDLRTTLYDSQLRISELEDSEQELKNTVAERDDEIKNLKASSYDLLKKLDAIKAYVDKLDGGNDE